MISVSILVYFVTKFVLPTPNTSYSFPNDRKIQKFTQKSLFNNLVSICLHYSFFAENFVSVLWLESAGISFLCLQSSVAFSHFQIYTHQSRRPSSTPQMSSLVALVQMLYFCVCFLFSVTAS